jgi:very-short-patch-repair endonuclease
MWTSADATASGIAERQSGVIHRSTLVDAGVSDAMILRRIEQGQLTRRAQSVYAYAGTPSTESQQLAAQALSVDDRACISHDSAAHLWGLIQRRPRRVHVAVERWQREHRSDCVVHESLDLEPDDRIWRHGIPLTIPERTIVDLGATSPWLVERALSTGIRLELFTIAEVVAVVGRVGRRGRRGVGVIRPLLAMHQSIDGRTESLLEDRFLRVLFDRGIAMPRTQHEVIDDSGRFVCRADFAYPQVKLLIEVDGRSYHSDSVAYQRDREKQNRTQALGWSTLRFTWHDIVRDADRTAMTVASWIEADPSVLA